MAETSGEPTSAFAKRNHLTPLHSLRLEALRFEDDLADTSFRFFVLCPRACDSRILPTKTLVKPGQDAPLFGRPLRALCSGFLPCSCGREVSAWAVSRAPSSR